MSAVAGVPEMKALPPLIFIRRPLGSLPETFRLGVGNPEVVIVKEARLPCLNVTFDAEVNFGAVPGTRLSVNLVRTGDLNASVTLLLPLMVNFCGEVVRLGSEPASRPVLDNRRPLGKLTAANVGAVVPLARLATRRQAPLRRQPGR
jgi:hypothetical protein